LIVSFFVCLFVCLFAFYFLFFLFIVFIFFIFFILFFFINTHIYNYKTLMAGDLVDKSCICQTVIYGGNYTKDGKPIVISVTQIHADKTGKSSSLDELKNSKTYEFENLKIVDASNKHLVCNVDDVDQSYIFQQDYSKIIPSRSTCQRPPFPYPKVLSVEDVRNAINSPGQPISMICGFMSSYPTTAESGDTYFQYVQMDKTGFLCHDIFTKLDPCEIEKFFGHLTVIRGLQVKSGKSSPTKKRLSFATAKVGSPSKGASANQRFLQFNHTTSMSVQIAPLEEVDFLKSTNAGSLFPDIHSCEDKIEIELIGTEDFFGGAGVESYQYQIFGTLHQESTTIDMVYVCGHKGCKKHVPTYDPESTDTDHYCNSEHLQTGPCNELLKINTAIVLGNNN
jgi:hypothetical protein